MTTRVALRREPHGFAARLLITLNAHRLAFGVIALIWGLALIRLFVHPAPLIPLVFNWTPSLPYRVAVLSHDLREFRRGDYILYAFDGEAASLYPGLRGQPFFKRVAGIAGDVITVQGRRVFINGQPVGYAQYRTADGHPLYPIAAGTIPRGQLYVKGTHPDSFDSRYQSSGLVRVEQIVARVHPLF